MTVRELEQRMDALEFAEWVELYKLEAKEAKDDGRRRLRR